MSCIEIKTKKYRTRKGPPYHAKDCRGKTKKGNDGKSYISAPDSKGVYKWIPKKDPARNTTRKKGKGVKTYTILDNGGESYIAEVYPSKIEVYEQDYHLDESTNKESYTRGKRVFSTPYKKLFVGDNLLNKKDGYAPKGMYPGNSILIQIKKGKYIYVGSKVYSFETLDGEEIQSYYSPVGNSVVPYPYAIGVAHTYIMLDKVSVPNTLLDFKEDVYGQYYGHTIDKDAYKIMKASTKKFTYKMIK